WKEKTREILEASRVPYEEEVPLARITTIGVGGPAAYLLRPDEVPPVAQALEGLTDEGIPVAFLGAGSNLLVSETGFPGVVMAFSDLAGEPHVEGERVRVRAGLRLPSLVSRLTKLGLS